MKQRIAVWGSAGAMLMLLAGCATMKRATGTYEVQLAAEPDRVVAAVEEALAELELEKISASATKLDGEVIGRTAQGKDVTIRVKREGEGVTRMSVKVGSLGDQTISDAVIDATQKRIKP